MNTTTDDQLAALRENRRAKGLFVEPTDDQIMELWRRYLRPAKPSVESAPAAIGRRWPSNPNCFAGYQGCDCRLRQWEIDRRATEAGLV